jgi:hypothetical protein
MSMLKSRNESLYGLLEEAGWSNEDLARAVIRVGRELGHRFTYDSSSVSHWKKDGTLPKKAARTAIVEAFARRLGRPVTLFEAGLMRSPESTPSDTDVVSGLIDLGSADMDPSRRAILKSGLYSATLAVPGWPEAGERFDRVHRDPHTHYGPSEVSAVRAMTEHLSALDDQFGGRTARPLAAAFLVNTIVPYLKATAPADIQADMLSAASDHLYLTGYMAMDERADELAQRYYVKALELAGAAQDHLTYCTTLRGMSVQAVDLGHGRQSVRLAEAANAACPKAGPRMKAFLYGQHAHALAESGDRSGALLSLKLAEAAMDKAESREKTFGSYNPSSMAYHIGQVQYALGDVAGSIKSLTESDRLRETTARRTRVRYNGMLAERKLRMGRLEEACADWGRVLDDYALVKSGRCDDRFNTMMSAIRPHLRNARARELYERGRSLSRAA